MVGKIEFFAHLKPGVLCIREASKEEVGTVVDLVVQVFSESNKKMFSKVYGMRSPPSWDTPVFGGFSLFKGSDFGLI